MKKTLSIITLLVVFSFSAFAQLGAPKTTAKDTFYFVGVMYNGTELDYNDWPAKYLVEDAVNIYIAGFTYKKGKPTYSDLYSYNPSWEGHIDYYSYDAICNGKKERISTVKPREDCKSEIYAKYVIGDYEFYLITKDKWNSL